MQTSPTPVPDHGTGWGLLLLFSWLYGLAVLLGVGTVGVLLFSYVERETPSVLYYAVLAALLAILVVAGFTTLVALTAGRYDTVVLLVLIVFLPLSFSGVRRRGTDRQTVRRLAHAAMVWSLPFLLGFGITAVVTTTASGIPPIATGVTAAAIVLPGTVGLDRLLFDLNGDSTNG